MTEWLEQAVEYQYDHVADNLHQAGDDIHNGNYLDAAEHGLNAWVDSMPGAGVVHSAAEDATDWAVHAFGTDPGSADSVGGSSGGGGSTDSFGEDANSSDNGYADGGFGVEG